MNKLLVISCMFVSHCSFCEQIQDSNVVHNIVETESRDTMKKRNVMKKCYWIAACVMLLVIGVTVYMSSSSGVKSDDDLGIGSSSSDHDSDYTDVSDIEGSDIDADMLVKPAIGHYDSKVTRRTKTILPEASKDMKLDNTVISNLIRVYLNNPIMLNKIHKGVAVWHNVRAMLAGHNVTERNTPGLYELYKQIKAESIENNTKAHTSQRDQDTMRTTDPFTHHLESTMETMD